MEALTTRQSRVMDFVRDRVVSKGYPPSLREIGDHFGFNFAAAKGHLKALARKGYIRLEPGRSRGIEVVDLHPPEALPLPLVGDIRAGSPILAVENLEGNIYVDKTLFGDEESFVLKVVGDSMVEAGIHEGDFVVVRPQPEVKNGEIGVAAIEDEATVKRIYVENSARGRVVRLVPENSSMSPMLYPASEVRIIGRVTGVIRKLRF